MMEVEQDLKIVCEELDNYMEAQVIDIVTQKREILDLVTDAEARSRVNRLFSMR